MSHSWSEDCPNCGKSADYSVESRPFEMHFITCYHCGLIVSPKIQYMDLEELNYHRKDVGKKSLKKLPKQRDL